VRAIEDKLSRLDLEEGAEVGQELDDEVDNEVKFWDIPMAFNSPRHLEDIVGEDLEMQTWRMRERMKTVSVALVICLNVGVDPPDVTKTQPCARKECWLDPMSYTPQKAVEAIGNQLQRQYERWQPRAR
jgi:regulator-associated protein of mTOR